MKVTASKQNLMAEDGSIVRTLHYLTIESEKGDKLVINVGQKTYETVKKMENEKQKNK